MQFDLRQLGRQGSKSADEHVERTFEAAQFGDRPVSDEGYRVAAPVHLVMDVRGDRDAYRVSGRVETTLELECGRCLELFQIPVASAFDLRYVPQTPGHATGEDEREVEEDDLTTAHYQDDKIDLEELMREQFQLALPMKPLCADSCRGLCPVCGTNLNKGQCSCAPKWEESRLAGLKGLLHKES
jgi:uncharacterized protein